MVEDLLAESSRRLEAASPACSDELRASDRPLISFSDALRSDLKPVRRFQFERMYRHYRVNRLTSKARRVLRQLFDIFLAEPNLLPDEWRRRAEDVETAARARVVADYVAGMTDRYALESPIRHSLILICGYKMNIFRDFQDIVVAQLEALTAEGELPADLNMGRVTVEPPRDSSHGDMATNAAMVLAKGAGRKPRELADLLAGRLREAEGVATVEIAGPVFINLRLHDELWYRELRGILEKGTSFGDSAIGQGRPANVEYVSANPTGPLTVGHARGAVVGDALAALLEKVGYRILREYYVNDAGGQVDALARSA